MGGATAKIRVGCTFRRVYRATALGSEAVQVPDGKLREMFREVGQAK